MATKLNHEVVGKMYVSGYNMKTIADMLGSVNGHISKVVRKMELPTRKRGEIVDVNYDNLNLTKTDAEYLSQNANLDLDNRLKNMVRGLMVAQQPVKEIAPKQEVAKVVEPKVEEPVAETKAVEVQVEAENVVVEPVAEGEEVLLKDVYTDQVERVAVMLQLAEEDGLSQRALAKVFGIGQPTINKAIKKYRAEAEALRANGFRHNA